MDAALLGTHFERETSEQPSVWERIAKSGQSERLANALEDDAILIGNGSSLFVAQLGALALRRRRFRAQALAATEARLDCNAYQNKTVVAISQSGQSTDVLEALDFLRPRRVIALTNTPGSALTARADVVVDVQAGPEIAVPASKSVSSTVAILLGAASRLSGESKRDAVVLLQTAAEVRAWLDSSALQDTIGAARRIALRRSVVFLGSDYGLPIASEAALKLKEAAYLHAEGFAAGEFSHGSIAMVDASVAVLGIADSDALPVLLRPFEELAKVDVRRYIIGTSPIGDVPRLGPDVPDAYNTLAWLVTVQTIALHVARARGVDSDAPRHLTKVVIAKQT